MCQQSKHHTLEQRSDTHTHTHPSRFKPILNTLPSILADTHTLHRCYFSFARSLSCGPGFLAVAAASLSICCIPPLITSLRSSSVFPHGFVNAALSHTRPTHCEPPRSDRCCSEGCVSHISTCQTTFSFLFIIIIFMIGCCSRAKVETADAAEQHAGHLHGDAREVRMMSATLLALLSNRPTHKHTHRALTFHDCQQDAVWIVTHQLH